MSIDNIIFDSNKYIIMKKWTMEEINDIVVKYDKGASIKEIALEYNCSMYIIRTRLKKEGVTIQKGRVSKIKKLKARVPLDIWTSKIGTPEFDYFLGILASDGCIVNTCIALEVKDLEILTNYNKFLNYTCNINHRVSKINGNVYYNIKYKNEEIVLFLSEYGIVPRKSNILTMPYMNWNLLLGIFDGDGSICKENKGDYCFKFSICSGSIEFINQIKEFLYGEGIESQIHEFSTKNSHWLRLEVCKGEDIYKIYCNLYKESPYFLSRKKEKFCPLSKKFGKYDSVNSVKGMDNHETEPSHNVEGAETRNGTPKR